jgi:hypothetical protein
MSNHRWNSDTCIKCGIKRHKKTIKYRMAITDFPPYDHYKYEQIYIYINGEGTMYQRPNCK